MPEQFVPMGDLLIELANVTESFRGPMIPPGVNITSPANQELKEDALWGNPATIEHPVYDTLAHLELLFIAACDHLRSLGQLLRVDPPSWFGYVAVARAVVETSSRLWYLTEPGIGSLERVRRNLMEQQYELRHQQGLLGANGPYQALPQVEKTALQQWVNDGQTRIGDWAQSVHLATQGNFLDGGRVGPTDLLVQLFDADPTAPHGQGAVLAAYNYNKESAVAHGLPSGVAMYHQTAQTGGAAQNVLASEHVGHAVLPVVTAFNSSFDRLATYFLWEHAELQPMRWPSIHEMNTLMHAPSP